MSPVTHSKENKYREAQPSKSKSAIKMLGFTGIVNRQTFSQGPARIFSKIIYYFICKHTMGDNKQINQGFPDDY